MATQIQFRRGTKAQHNSFTGATAEVTVNTTDKSLHVHDGTTQGGFELARVDLSNHSGVGVLTATTFSGNVTGNVTGNINSSGISTLNTVVVGGATTALIVNGNARVTGILTIGTSSLTLDGINDRITVGTGLTITSTEITIGSITIGSGSLTGTATSTTNIPNLTGAITSVNTTTSLGSFTSANLATALTDETGSGAAVFATSPTLVTPALGTPQSGTLTNCTGLPTAGLVDNAVTDSKLRDSAALSIIGRSANSSGDPADITAEDHQVLRRSGSTLVFGSISLNQSAAVTGTLPVARGGTGITSFGSGVATFLGTPTSSNLKTVITDETGGGALVFATSPTLVTPALGTPSSGTLTSCTGLPLTTGVTGTLPVANGGTGVTVSTGTGSVVLSTSPTLTTPVLGAASASSINVSGIVTATQFVTGASGSAIGINTNTISGPATITIDPAGVGDNTGLVVIKGDLQIDGTTTTINSTTVTVDDKNIVLGSGAANDAAADGSGITVESGDGNKTFQFEDTGDNLGSSENINVATGKVYKVNNTEVLSATTLGSGVVNSSLTSVGTLTNLSVGNVNSSGIITATTFVGALTGTATSTTNIPNLTGDITSANTATTLATVNSNVGTFGSGGAIPSITVNAKGLITGVTTTAVDPANDGTLTLAVSGTGLSGSASFTANQSSASSFTVTSNATSANTNSTIVARDGSGNFSAGTITASLTGTATSTTNIPNLTGDVTSVNSVTSIAAGVIVNADINASAAIAVSKLAASTISGVTLGNNLNALTISTGLSGSSYNGSGAVTIAIDSTVATLTGTQTLTNKTLTSPTLTTPALGTPSSGTLTSCTGLPVSTGISGLAANVATFLATPSSANLISAVTNETGTGSLVFATSPTLVTPALGTPSSGTLTSCTGLPITGITSSTTIGLGVGSIELGHATDTTLARSAAGVVTIEGVEVVTLSRTQTLTNKTLTSPTLTTPALGTPASGTLTSCTGLPIVAGTTGTLSVARGGTGVTASTGTGSVVLSASPTFTGTVGAAAITATGDIAAANFNSTSDISLKDNIQTIVNPIDKITKLNGVTFNWKENQKPSIGVIAQELEKVLPELVTQGDIKSVNYNGLIGVLIEAVKEQQKQIDELKAIVKNQ